MATGKAISWKIGTLRRVQRLKAAKQGSARVPLARSHLVNSRHIEMALSMDCVRLPLLPLTSSRGFRHHTMSRANSNCQKVPAYTSIA